jgi:hypothetical protein
MPISQPELKIRKRRQKSSAPNFKNPKKYFLNVLKGPFQHIKNLAPHFLIRAGNCPSNFYEVQKISKFKKILGENFP